MPRAKRSAQKTEEPQTSATPPEPPKCAGCGRELTWRDRFYLGATTEQCKTCHQRDWHKRLGIVGFHPAVTQVKQKNGKTVEVPVRFNRVARRGHGKVVAHAGQYAAQRIATWGAQQARRLNAKRARRSTQARATASATASAA